MDPETRALLAAAALALATGGKVAGLYDHAAGCHRRIAAEARGIHLQGYDGDRGARFGGSLPELQDAGSGATFHVEIEGHTLRGYDRSSARHFIIEVRGQTVQLYDHGIGTWFAFNVQVA